MDDTPYASNLQRLETELQEEERAVALETEALQLRLDTLTQKSFHLELESKSLDLDEQNYFHSFNDFKKDLKCHVDQRDAVVTQVEQVGRQLVRMAQRTNPKTVYCVRWGRTSPVPPLYPFTLALARQWRPDYARLNAHTVYDNTTKTDLFPSTTRNG